MLQKLFKKPDIKGEEVWCIEYVGTLSQYLGIDGAITCRASPQLTTRDPQVYAR
jgi:hypothetical protein